MSIRTDTDATRGRCEAHRAPATTVPRYLRARLRMKPEEPVSRVMTETVVVIEVDRPVSEVLDCFFQYPIHHLPVVRDGKLPGC